MAPQLKIPVCDGRKKKILALSRKENRVLFSFNNGDGLKAIAYSRLISVTNGGTI